jgi:hypothetical protein
MDPTVWTHRMSFPLPTIVLASVPPSLRFQLVFPETCIVFVYSYASLCTQLLSAKACERAPTFERAQGTFVAFRFSWMPSNGDSGIGTARRREQNRGLVPCLGCHLLAWVLPSFRALSGSACSSWDLGISYQLLL